MVETVTTKDGPRVHLRWERRKAVLVCDELDREQQSQTSDVTDQRRALRDRFEPGAQACSDPLRVCHEIALHDLVEHC